MVENAGHRDAISSLVKLRIKRVPNGKKKFFIGFGLVALYTYYDKNSLVKLSKSLDAELNSRWQPKYSHIFLNMLS